MKTKEDRFSGKFEKTEGCWIWCGCKSGQGYGIVCLPNKKKAQAHRVSYEIHRGPVPAGMLVCHRCDVRDCVNPGHLFLGTPLDNVRDMVSKKRNMHITKPWTLARGEKNGANTKPETVRRGSKIEWAKLTEAKVQSIRARFAAGEPAPQIAKTEGVYFGTIYKVVYRHTWRHVA